MKRIPFVIVGGGPAGLSAAIEAAACGVQLAVFDENPLPGGQYFRQMPESFRVVNAPGLGKEYAQGRTLLETFRGRGIDWRPNSLVWGIFEDKVVGVFDGTTAFLVRAECLLLAPGAYDRPVPFPGWTLPGILTAGGAQNLVKAQRVLPGRRVLLSGSGPLQLVVANNLIKAGAEVVAVCEASPMRGLWRQVPNVWGHWGLLRDGWHYLQGLRRARVPLLKGHSVIRAEGREAVEAAVVAELNGEGRPVPGSERRFAVDALVLGYGFVPSTELARLAGCEHRYVPGQAAWVPVADRHRETTISGLLVAGDGAGVAGAAVAMEEGRMAGLWAAHRLGHLSEREVEDRTAPIATRLSDLDRFRQALDAIYPPPRGLLALMTDDTIICRCEEVSAAVLKEAIADGAGTVAEVKAWTRCGMGRCQGRMCGPALALLLARTTGRSEAEVGIFSPRPPVKPVPLGALADLEVGAAS